MAILESQLNGRIATLLGRVASRWDVHGESRGAFQGSQRQPDILIVQPGAQPVVIENEYLPANTVEAEARDRLGESLDASVVQASGRINATVALRSPAELHDCGGLDDVDGMLGHGVTLEYALFAGLDGVDRGFRSRASYGGTSGISRHSSSMRPHRRMPYRGRA